MCVSYASKMEGTAQSPPLYVVKTLFGSGLCLGHRSRSAVGFKLGNIFSRISESCENLVGVSAESRARTVCRSIVAQGKWATYSDEFADLATLVNLNECVAVI